MLQTVASLLSFAKLALIYINDDSCTPRQQFPSYTSLRPIQRPTRCMKYTATRHMNLKQVVEQVATSFASKNSPIGAVQFERLPMEQHLQMSGSIARMSQLALNTCRDGCSPLGRGDNVTTLLRTIKLYVSIHISAWQWHMHDHGRPVVNQPLSNPNIPNDLASSHAVSPVSLLMHSPVGPFDPLASAEVRKSPAPDQYLTSRFTVCCWYLPYPKIIGLDSIWTCPFWDLFQPLGRIQKISENSSRRMIWLYNYDNYDNYMITIW